MTTKIGFQGIPGAYSEMAARHFFPDQGDLIPQDDFLTLFKKVESRELDFGAIPIENSLAGSIHENYDHLQAMNVWISSEYHLRVSHCLLGVKGAKKEAIREVYSHPQALAQCAHFIRSLPQANPVPFFDTAGSAEYVAGASDPTKASIASALAAKKYQLEILATAIEDNEKNYTRFLLIGKKPREETIPYTGTMKTSIVFALKNIPGCLHKCLSVFAIRDIDLFKIESRPIPGSPWQYVFYLDFEGSIAGEAQKRAIAHLEEITAFLKVLGSYPMSV